MHTEFFRHTHIYGHAPYDTWDYSSLKIAASWCVFPPYQLLWCTEEEDSPCFLIRLFPAHTRFFWYSVRFQTLIISTEKDDGIRVVDSFVPTIRFVINPHGMTSVTVLLSITFVAVQLPVTSFDYL